MKMKKFLTLALVLALFLTGNALALSSSTTGATDNYYVKMNPEGPYAKGVHGKSTLKN